LRYSMMRSTLKKAILAVAAPALLFFACKKYTDPARPDVGDGLKNGYCNDPRAINYNWDFPGTPDSTTCIFPKDPFLGTWSYKDYVTLPNGDTDAIVDRSLVFTATEDTLRSHLAVAGWCSGNIPFYVTATKYRKATVDTIPGSPLGQFLCDNSDTLNGTLDQAAWLGDTMRVDFVINNDAGIKYHRGLAVRQ